MAAKVVPIRGGQVEDLAAVAERALVVFVRCLDRSSLADKTRAAYRRQGRAYVAWLLTDPAAHPDAFTDQVGADAAVTGWRRRLLAGERGPRHGPGVRVYAPSSVNQALAAVALLYRVATPIRPVVVKVARVPRPGAPQALSRAEQGAVERASQRYGATPAMVARNAALVAVLLYTGARVAECAALSVDDVRITARTGTVRLVGKGDQVRTVELREAREAISAWLQARGPDPGPLFTGQRGPLTKSGVEAVLLAVGYLARLSRPLRPHLLRHTYGTRLRESGADLTVIAEAMGHTSLDTTRRYVMPSAAEVAGPIARAFDDDAD